MKTIGISLKNVIDADITRGERDVKEPLTYSSYLVKLKMTRSVLAKHRTGPKIGKIVAIESKFTHARTKKAPVNMSICLQQIKVWKGLI